MLATLLATTGCSDMGGDFAERALAETVDAGHTWGIQRDLLHLTRDIDFEASPEQVATQLADRIGDCAAIADAEGPVTHEYTIAFEPHEGPDTCTFRGRTWTGAVTIAAESTSGGMHVHFNYDLDKVGQDGSMRGVSSIDASADRREIDGDVEIDGRRGSRHILSQRTEVPLDGGDFDAGVRVDGTRTMEGDLRRGGAGRLSDKDSGQRVKRLEGLEYMPGERVPQAGEVWMEGPRGGHRVLSFGRLDETRIEVFARHPRHGQRRLVVDAVTGDVLESHPRSD